MDRQGYVCFSTFPCFFSSLSELGLRGHRMKGFRIDPMDDRLSSAAVELEEFQLFLPALNVRNSGRIIYRIL